MDFDREKERIKDYQIIFDSDKGKRVVYDLMAKHFVLVPSFSTDPLEMAYREGQRTVILKILGLLNINPEKLKSEIEKGDEYVGHYNTRRSAYESRGPAASPAGDN